MVAMGGAGLVVFLGDVWEVGGEVVGVEVVLVAVFIAGTVISVERVVGRVGAEGWSVGRVFPVRPVW